MSPISAEQQFQERKGRLGGQEAKPHPQIHWEAHWGVLTRFLRSIGRDNTLVMLLWIFRVGFFLVLFLLLRWVSPALL